MLKKFLTRTYWTKKKIAISSVALIVVVLVLSALGGGNGKENVVTVERADIKEEVVITGKVKANSQVDMGFDGSGRVAKVYADVGQKVSVGQVLAELDYSEAAAELARERSLLRAEEIKLEEIKRNGPSSLREAESNLSAAMKEAYSAADNAVRNKADQFFKTPRTNPSFEIKIADGNYIHYFPVPADQVLELNNFRRQAENILVAWPTEDEKVVEAMNTISRFLDSVALAVNTFTTTDYTYEATVTGFKTSIDSARSGVSSARSKVIAAQQSVSSSPVLGSAGVSSVASQEAKVAQMQASVASKLAVINKLRIIAPFEGVVTKQDAKLGEAVSSGDKLVSLISDQMYLEANVSEVNVGKVSVGNTVQVSFDAFPDQSFVGKVTFIDPAETIIDQVVNYKLRIEFEPDSRVGEMVKSGLTANVRIKTHEKTGVLVAPSYAIEKENGKSFVNVVTEGEETSKVEVQTGLVGSDGKVEILSGINEGDRIIFKN